MRGCLVPRGGNDISGKFALSPRGNEAAEQRIEPAHMLKTSCNKFTSQQAVPKREFGRHVPG